MLKKTKEQQIAVILGEIAWCEVHRGGSEEGDEWENGFIEGLKQALRLIRSRPTQHSVEGRKAPPMPDNILDEHERTLDILKIFSRR